MQWHVRYRQATTERVLWFKTPEEAIEAACVLLDNGQEVFGIGTDDLSDAIAAPEIARIYRLWDGARLL